MFTVHAKLPRRSTRPVEELSFVSVIPELYSQHVSHTHTLPDSRLHLKCRLQSTLLVALWPLGPKCPSRLCCDNEEVFEQKKKKKEKERKVALDFLCLT